MPRKDRIHEVVKTALVKAGWTITHDPFRIHSLFTRQSFQLIVHVHRIALLIVSEPDEEIVRWIDSAPVGA